MTLKSELFDNIDLKVGSGKDLTGGNHNALLKELYETAEAYLAEESAARAAADEALQGDVDGLESDLAAVEEDISEIDAALALLSDYQLVGFAIPSTNPGTVAKKFWIAKTNGTYTHFVDDENTPYEVLNELVIFTVDNDVMLKLKLCDLPDQELLTTSEPTFATLKLTDLPSGTLLVQPSGIDIGDLWLDTTDSVSNPQLRMKVS